MRFAARLFTIGITTGALLFSFQNCSSYDVAKNASSNNISTDAEPAPEETIAKLTMPAQAYPSVTELKARFTSEFNKGGVNMSPWTLSSLFEDILISARGTGNHEYTELLIESGYALTARTSVALGISDPYTGLTAHVLLHGIYTCGVPAANLAHHANIWAPIVEGIVDYLKKAGSTPEPGLAPKAAKIISVSLLGLNYFDHSRKIIDGRVQYVGAFYPLNCPAAQADNKYAGLPVPVNFSAIAGELALTLTDFFRLPVATLSAVASGYATNKNAYLMRQESNVTQAFNGVMPYLNVISNGNVIWKYMPGGRPEDTSHGASVVRFLVKAQKNGRLSNDVTVGVIKTMKSVYSTGPSASFSHIEPYMSGGVDVRRRGNLKYAQGLSRWIHLSIYDCSAYHMAMAIQNFKRSDNTSPYRNSKTALLLEFYKPHCS